MKIGFRVIVTVLLCLKLAPAFAQPGATSDAIADLPQSFGEIFKGIEEFSAYSAAFAIQTKGTSSVMTFTMAGKIAAMGGKRRIEMDMESMLTNDPYFRLDGVLLEKGMRIVFVLRPDKKVCWRAYSWMDGYFESPMKDSSVIRPKSDVKIEVTELGKEIVDGHPCLKNKVVETDKEGKIHEFTVWNATDLKKFPVKIEEDSLNMSFKDVKLVEPDAALFEPPATKKANALSLALDLTRLIRAIRNERTSTNAW